MIEKEKKSKDEASSWYVLKVTSGREDKIKAAIEGEFKISKADKYLLQILVPSEKVYNIKGSKKKLQDKVFFPGYIFLELTGLAESVISSLRSIQGVWGFLSSRSWGWAVEPVSMKKNEIEAVFKISLTKRDVSEEEFYVNVGDSVKVVEGPFKGLIGTVNDVFKEKKRVNVIIRIFDRPAPVELAYSQLEKVI